MDKILKYLYPSVNEDNVMHSELRHAEQTESLMIGFAEWLKYNTLAKQFYDPKQDFKQLLELYKETL